MQASPEGGGSENTTHSAITISLLLPFSFLITTTLSPQISHRNSRKAPSLYRPLCKRNRRRPPLTCWQCRSRRSRRNEGGISYLAGYFQKKRGSKSRRTRSRPPVFSRMILQLDSLNSISRDSPAKIQKSKMFPFNVQINKK